MKKLITLVFAAVLIMSNQSFSQSGLLVTDYDNSEYPKVTFDYFIFENAVNQKNAFALQEKHVQSVCFFLCFEGRKEKNCVFLSILGSVQCMFFASCTPIMSDIIGV